MCKFEYNMMNNSFRNKENGREYCLDTFDGKDELMILLNTLVEKNEKLIKQSYNMINRMNHIEEKCYYLQSFINQMGYDIIFNEEEKEWSLTYDKE